MMTFVNVLRVPSARESEFVEKWDAGADYVRGQSGLVWTSLHKATSEGDQLRYFTIAVWESREHFATATASEWWRNFSREFGFSSSSADFGAEPSVCDVIRAGGPFEP